MGRTIVVGQRSLERAGLAFAATELWREGDTIVLVHVAAVLPPSTVTLHSAPQTTFSVDPHGDLPKELLDKVTSAVRSRVVAGIEAPGAVQLPITLKVELLPSQEWGAALARDAADAIVNAARGAGASVLVLARDEEDGAGAADDGEGGARPEAPSGVEALPAPLKAAAGVVERVVADVQRVGGELGKRLVQGAPLSEEVLRRADGLAVVLVPAGFGGERDAVAAARSGAHGEGGAGEAVPTGVEAGLDDGRA